MIRWEPPGPYEVAFSTRDGGVSEGPYASLNLGRMTGDDVERVDENRRRALRRGRRRRPTGSPLNRQVHSTPRAPRRAGRARRAGRRALDGGAATLPVLAISADCLPIALARVGRRPPARRRPARRLARPARGHRRRRRRARSAAGVARGDRARDRAVLLRGRRRGGRAVRGGFGRTCMRGGNLDLWTRGRAGAPRGGRRGGRARRPLHSLQPGALLLAPPRPGKPRGVQGVIARVA